MLALVQRVVCCQNFLLDELIDKLELNVLNFTDSAWHTDKANWVGRQVVK